jgi:hypothetical protein
VTGEEIRDLLTPCIGKPGRTAMWLHAHGTEATTSPDCVLTEVTVRPGGSLLIKYDGGCSVWNPAEIAGVVWNETPPA